MPYVQQSDRDPVDALMQDFAPVREWSAGQVAYAVYRIMREYVRVSTNFLSMAVVTGAVVLTVARFVLKVVMPYEDKKEAENGGIE